MLRIYKFNEFINIWVSGFKFKGLKQFRQAFSHTKGVF